MSSGPPIQYTSFTPTATTPPPSTPTTQPAHYPNHYPNVPVQPASTYYSAAYATTTVAIPGAPTTSNAVGLIAPGLPTQNDYLHKYNSPAPARPPTPPEPAITPSIATHVVRRLVENELIDVGFETAESQAVRRLEVEVVSFIQQLFDRAHEYANLANRAGALPPDIILACDDFGIEPKELYPLARKCPLASSPTADNTSAANTPTASTPQRKRLKRKTKINPAKLTFSSSRSPSPDLLPSDDESGPPVIPTTLRGLPPYFPQLPPKHTYLQTPASPPKKAALPSLEKKLKTAGLVQESLKNLLLATEDSTGQEDAELLGHIVNWETGLHPRKRWRVSGR